MNVSNQELLCEDLEDLLDDHRYKCEELKTSKTALQCARCYLELICIQQQQLEQVVRQLDPENTTSYCWDAAQEILFQDPTEFHREALRLHIDSCEQLLCLVTCAAKYDPSPAESVAQPQVVASSRRIKPAHLVRAMRRFSDNTRGRDAEHEP